MESVSSTAPTPASDTTPSGGAGGGSIMMWGAKGSGKSIYLASLVYWSPPLDDDERLCVLPANATAAEWVADRVRGLQQAPSARHHPTAEVPAAPWDGSMTGPATPTPIPAIYKTMTERRLDFRLYSLPTATRGLPRLRGSESRVEASLSFWDVPGEVYDGDIPPNILREMIRARGLILLVNPSYAPDEGRETYYLRFFDRTLGKLKFALADAWKRGERVPFDPKTNQITLPVAICMSQVDRSADHMDAEPKALFEEIVGDTAPMLYSWLTTYEIFKITALGRPLARAGEREYLDGSPEPRFVHLPIQWIVRAGPRSEERGARDRVRSGAR
jgi:hypothetical protein